MEDLAEPLLEFELPKSGEVLDQLGRLESLVERYRQHKIAGRILPNSIESMRVELTYHSNAIEGSTLTLRDTQLIVEGLEPNTGKSLREIYEARNHDRALRLVESWAKARGSSASLTEQDILEIHAQVMADIDLTSAGPFRQDRVLITGTRFIPPSPLKFDILIAKMLELANQKKPIPLLAAELHYNFVAIHPFGDGNGRTARLLMNYQFLRNNYPLVVIPVEQRQRYLSALEAANQGLSEPFQVFILNCAADSILQLIGYEF